MADFALVRIRPVELLKHGASHLNAMILSGNQMMEMEWRKMNLETRC